jgi:OMF family outer membrane factor
MILEYEKALLQNENFRKIYTLKKDTYEKNFNQFKENILPLDKLLISQNDMLTSRLMWFIHWQILVLPKLK